MSIADLDLFICNEARAQVGNLHKQEDCKKINNKVNELYTPLIVLKYNQILESKMITNFFDNIIVNGLCPYIDIKLDNEGFNLESINIKFSNYESGFRHYKGIRYLFRNNYIIEYNIDFFKMPKLKYLVINSELGNLNISKDTFIHEFIRLLKYSNVSYNEIKTIHEDFFIIQTFSKVNIYFDLELGKLYRIGKLFIEL